MSNEQGGREYAGRVAVVTGGGRGFGQAFGTALTERGAHAVLADIDGAAAIDAAAQIVATGGSAQGVACDVSDEAQVQALVKNQIAAEHGGIDILINNAGLHSHAYSRPIAEMGMDKIRRLFDVNVMGVITCSVAARAAMEGREGASIINISSSAAYNGGSMYGVSKLAVQGLTMAMAREFGSAGIRVNAIAPGLIFTDTIRAELSEASVGRVMAQQMLAREGEERDIVEAMLYLTSSRSSFVTGETLRVSGGFAVSV